MKPFAIELDDRAVSLARDGVVISSSPGAVFDGGVAGGGARAEAVGGVDGGTADTTAWHALRSHPTATSSHHWESALTQPDVSERTLRLVAADLSSRLAVSAPTAKESVWMVAPAIADARGLGTILGVARALSVTVDGFIDAATAVVAALGIERGAIVLELGLHHAAATAIDAAAGIARRRRTVQTNRGGLVELYQAWIEFISTAMVKRTRFDPLHDAVTEQALFDAIPALAREVESTGAAKAALSKGADRFEVELSRDQFALAAQPLTREILRLVHELRPAGTAVTLVLPEFLAGIPGVREEVEQFVDCELVGIPDGFAAAAVSLLDLPGHAANDSVQLVRRLALQTQTTLTGTVSRTRLGGRRAGGPPPTHLLLEGRAISIGSQAVVVGREPEAARAVTLPDGLAGVSRRHCTFLRDGEDLVLLDHSSFGTFVNGERVAERVRVYAGDRVRLGEPGIELALISV